MLCLTQCPQNLVSNRHRLGRRLHLLLPQNGIRTGQVCPTCLRGVLANKDFEPNEVIMKIPFEATIRFKSQLAFPAEFAHELVDRMHNEPGFNDTFALFWEAHPSAEHVFTPEVGHLWVG
jgi:hypothetical protein